MRGIQRQFLAALSHGDSREIHNAHFGWRFSTRHQQWSILHGKRCAGRGQHFDARLNRNFNSLLGVFTEEEAHLRGAYRLTLDRFDLRE